MAYHHTKNKGDIGLGHIIADLLEHNIQVALPISEHQPYDCIAITNNKILRVSVKARAVNKFGQVQLALKSSYTDKNGTHVKKHNFSDYDVIAIWCPDTKSCYYLLRNEINETITLRVTPAKNNQKRDIKLASEYSDANRLLGA